MQSCSRCGYLDRPEHPEPRKLCQSPDGSSCDVCSKLDYLNAEITRAKAVFQDLLDQRDGLRAQLNLAHPSIIHRLPVEVASTIFTLYVLNVSQTDSPFTLGAVCKRWRQIAWSAPSVWTTLNMSIAGNTITDTLIQLATEWLSRAGRLPLSITFDTDNLLDSDPELPKFYPMIDIINKHANQWYSLDLYLPFSLLARLNDRSCVSSILHKLSLSSPEVNDLTIHTLSRVTPRIVKIRGPILDPLSLNWSHVTHLNTTLLAFDEILQIFRLGPSLRNCHFGLASARDEGLWPEAYSHVTHALIRSLDIELAVHDTMDLIFDNLTLPALEHLRVRGSGVSSSAEELVAFFIRSSSGLKSLKIDELDFTSEDLIRVTRSTPSLEMLHVTLISPEQDQLDSFYHALASHLPTADNPVLPASTEPLLPSLRAFHWFGDGAFPWELIQNFLVPLSQDDRSSRRPLEVIEVRCNREEENDPIPYIDANVLLHLSKFADQVQFQFEVLLDGKPGDLWEMSLEKIREDRREDSTS